MLGWWIKTISNNSCCLFSLNCTQETQWKKPLGEPPFSVPVWSALNRGAYNQLWYYTQHFTYLYRLDISPPARRASSWEQKRCMWARRIEIHFLTPKRESHVRWFIQGKADFPGSLPNQCRELSSPWPCCRSEAEHLGLLWRTRGSLQAT